MVDERTAALAPESADQLIRLTEDLVAKNKLTAMMVADSMQQAASLGDHLIVVVGGQIMFDLHRPAKSRLTPESTLSKFEEVRRID